MIVSNFLLRPCGGGEEWLNQSRRERGSIWGIWNGTSGEGRTEKKMRCEIVEVREKRRGD